VGGPRSDGTLAGGAEAPQPPPGDRRGEAAVNS
jgi:hypothetical protein